MQNNMKVEVRKYFLAFFIIAITNNTVSLAV